MQAVAQELVRRGHQVVWLTSEENEARVVFTGASHFKTTSIAFIDSPLSRAQETGLLDPHFRRLTYRRLMFRLIGQLNDYRRVLRGFDADVVLVDVLPFGARALHELGEIPVYATLGVIPMYTSGWGAPHARSGDAPPASSFALVWIYLHHLFIQWIVLPLLLRSLLNRQRKNRGFKRLPYGEPLESFKYSPFLHIQASSASLEFNQLPKPMEYRDHTHFVGPLVTKVPSTLNGLPSWWEDIVKHPRVVGITQGTLAMNPNSLIIPAIEALSGDAKLLLVITSPYPDAIRAQVGDLPNVRYATFLPYHLFLPQLCLLITNGGYGSVTQALSHKVPMICAGQTEDKKDTAARVEWAGAGIDLKTDHPSTDQVRNAAMKILGDGGYKERAARLGDELNELGGAAKACDLLEMLAQSHLRLERKNE
ncbi:hypothetical protein B0T10DRAFT_395791 [Thelonectria olida]|uniref:Erythromycin biosynthesis protein CIII-like C-terminal domain-containing protein n=1 Tax=Thelonectria olida TaxID=1576542 RepID=A0A9P8WBT4_9HYPO|nr:hypothetical protein B0T10DRAFT_395791 [Thelonectria olida]